MCIISNTATTSRLVPSSELIGTNPLFFFLNLSFFSVASLHLGLVP